jgi:hypothetical protein
MEFSNEERINYYLNNLKCVSFCLDHDMLRFDYDKIFAINKEKLHEYQDLNSYFRDMIKYMSLVETKKYFVCSFGDCFQRKTYPCFIKTKKISENSHNVLLNLDTERHTSMLQNIKNIDKPFASKKNMLLWRGVSTGNHIHGLRRLAVKKFQNHPNQNIDIKYNALVQGINNDNNEYILGDHKPLKQQLDYKFLLSIEGNDVASNLKWMLLSNSVVLMPVPKICSWFMEDKLQPFIHYVPVNDDFSDLENKYNWCLNNDSLCENISRNATQYIEQFMNENKENEITKRVIETYLERVNIEHPV